MDSVTRRAVATGSFAMWMLYADRSRGVMRKPPVAYTWARTLLVQAKEISARVDDGSEVEIVQAHLDLATRIERVWEENAPAQHEKYKERLAAMREELS